MIAVAVAVVVHGRRVALLLLVAPLADILLWWWSCPGNPLPQDTAIVAARALSGGTRGFSSSWQVHATPHETQTETQQEKDADKNRNTRKT